VPLETALFEALATGAPTAAGVRVFHVLAPQASALPRITFSRASNTPVTSLSGSSGLDQVRMQVDCWAASYPEAKALARQVRTILQAQPFKALMQNDFDDYEVETATWRVSMDFRCWDYL
jgi:hypothetical protein